MRYLILSNTSEDTTEKPEKEEWEKPKDWAYMEQSGETLRDIPDTWKKYPHDLAGLTAIVDMEYQEFKQAKTYTEKSHELVHLGSAALYLWRYLNHAE